MAGVAAIVGISFFMNWAMGEPETHAGIDSDSSVFRLPAGCILYQVPDSGQTGEHMVRLNDAGQADPNGENTFTVTIGVKEGESYSQVLQWESNFPVFAVFVNNDEAFHLYPYPGFARSGGNLHAPKDATGVPSNIHHVSVLVYPINPSAWIQVGEPEPMPTDSTTVEATAATTVETTAATTIPTTASTTVASATSTTVPATTITASSTTTVTTTSGTATSPLTGDSDLTIVWLFAAAMLSGGCALIVRKTKRAH